MSHQRYPSSHDAVKEPHSVSLKVLRLSRPSLVTQYPLQPPFSLPATHPPPVTASLAYSPNGGSTTNPEPFVLSPILNLPPSFGSAYVGETFSCTLCANHDIPPTTSVPEEGLGAAAAAAAAAAQPTAQSKTILDVRVEAEMKTPSSAAPVKLTLLPSPPTDDGSSSSSSTGGVGGGGGVDLNPGESLQRILSFDLKEEGNHVLAVTVSYYEASALSGRTRTFRKLYQFVCKASLVVRTKASALTAPGRWVLEAQLENCSEDVLLLERVVLELEAGLGYRDFNWDGDGGEEGEGEGRSKEMVRGKPVLQPGEVEQVCFVIEEEDGPVPEQDGRVVFGVLQIGWRSEMGNRGFLSTGKLGTRFVKPR
ncbi:hypothetical protein VTK56DRAFT_4883 [Thermocarpiscus australiensis]